MNRSRRTFVISIAVACTVGLVFATTALTTPLKQLFMLEKPGAPAKQMEGRKDTISTVAAPPAYRTQFGPSTGRSSEQAAIRRAVRDSFDLEREAMLVANEGKGAEYKKRFAEVFSDSAGELTKRRGFVDNNKAASDGLGVVVKESGVSKMEFRQIEVSGAEATAVVDAWTFSVYDQTKEVDPAKRLVRSGNAAQHTIRLVVEDGRWKVASDRSTYLPGMSPAEQQ